MRFGSLEAGGTKMVMAIGDEYGTILDEKVIPTTTPVETMPQIIEYFEKADIIALGVGCFGPIDLNRESETYGYITTTPKKAWANFDIVGVLSHELSIPVGFDTDVNASALGEVTYGTDVELDSLVYITIGTGVGVGVYTNNGLLHNMMHPEAGHMIIPRESTDAHPSVCPYHDHCLEGLASGPSIQARWGKPAVELTEIDAVWELEAFYIAQGIANLILTLSPQKIVLGGGVMHQEKLFPLIRQRVSSILNGYIQTPELSNLDGYIVPSRLEDKQGIKGCLRLAHMELMYRMNQQL